MENERVRRKYFKNLNKKVYIGRVLEITRDKGTEAVSVHRVTKELQYNTASMYRCSEGVKELLHYANLGYLDEYLEELNIREKGWCDIWDMHIDIWEYCYRIVFRYLQAFDIILFSFVSRNLTAAIREYYDAFPERINIISPYLQVILQPAGLFEYDMVMVERCAQASIIMMGNTMEVDRMICLLYRRYLEDILNYDLKPERIEDKIQESKRDVGVIVDIYASDTLGHDYITNTR